MANNTPNLELYKKDPVTDGLDTFNIQTMLNENWDKIDDSIGDKTIDDTLIPSTDTGLSVKILLSWLANMIKSITGKASWRIKPTKNLEELNTALTTHQAERTPHMFTGAKARGSINQSIPNATTTILELLTTVFDTNEMISSSKIYTKVAGYYLITATVVFESNANGYRELVIRKNSDNTLLTTRRVRSVDSVTSAFGASIVVYLNANEYITLAVSQNSGTALNTIASTFTPELSVVKVG